MKHRDLYSLVFFCALCLMLPATVHAETEPAETAAPSSPAGVSIDAGFASAYNFRGVNVFGATQSDQHLVFSPSISYSILDTGLSIGYWGAYQINGDNLEANVDAALGHEQDIIIGYSTSWLDDTLAFDAVLTVFLYPFADEDVAGVTCPAYIEPSVTLTYSTVLDFSLQVAYFAAIQEEIEDFRYLYIRPYISKSFQLTKRVTQTIGVGYGYKLFNDRDNMVDNVHDIAFDFETSVAITDSFYVAPAFRGGWTNLKKKSAGEEYFLLGSVNIGFSF